MEQGTSRVRGPRHRAHPRRLPITQFASSFGFSRSSPRAFPVSAYLIGNDDRPGSRDVRVVDVWVMSPGQHAAN